MIYLREISLIYLIFDFLSEDVIILMTILMIFDKVKSGSSHSLLYLDSRY